MLSPFACVTHQSGTLVCWEVLLVCFSGRDINVVFLKVVSVSARLWNAPLNLYQRYKGIPFKGDCVGCALRVCCNLLGFLLGFVWCCGQAAKEEKLETEQEEDEPAAMTFLENFPCTYMICQICGWKFYRTHPDFVWDQRWYCLVVCNKWIVLILPGSLRQPTSMNLSFASKPSVKRRLSWGKVPYLPLRVS